MLRRLKRLLSAFSLLASRSSIPNSAALLSFNSPSCLISFKQHLVSFKSLLLISCLLLLVLGLIYGGGFLGLVHFDPSHLLSSRIENQNTPNVATNLMNGPQTGVAAEELQRIAAIARGEVADKDDDEGEKERQGDRSSPLLQILQAASLQDAFDSPSVIVTSLSLAWTDMFDFFLQQLELGQQTKHLTKHLVVVCSDEGSFEYCEELRGGRKKKRLWCYLDEEEASWVAHQNQTGLGEKQFLTPSYLHLVWNRLKVNLKILKLGFSYVYTDTDIIWFKNPFPFFKSDADFFTACDVWSEVTLHAIANGGFSFVRSSNRSIAFLTYWLHQHESRFPGKHDQDAFMLIRPDVDPFTRDEIGLKLKYLSTRLFSGVCQPSPNLREAVTFHANCCIKSENKLRTLRKVMDDWKWFWNLPKKVYLDNLKHNLGWRGRICGEL